MSTVTYMQIRYSTRDACWILCHTFFGRKRDGSADKSS